MEYNYDLLCIKLASKVSEISVAEIISYLREDANDVEVRKRAEQLLDIAKSYISGYTGIPIIPPNEGDESLDTYPDFVVCVLVLIQDMYDNRSLYVEKSNINKTVDSILNLHSRNLL